MGALHEASKDALDPSPTFSSSSICCQRRDDPSCESVRRSSFGTAHLVKFRKVGRKLGCVEASAVHPVAEMTLLGANGSSEFLQLPVFRRERTVLSTGGQGGFLSSICKDLFWVS